MAEFYENIEVNGTLDSSGKITTSELKITTGAEATKVLTSDVDGNATWEDATGGIALTALSMTAEGLAAGDGNVSYNNLTGEFTYTPPDLTGLATGTNTGDVTLSGTPDYLTIAGQDITLAQIDLTTDVTGLLPTANVADLTGVNSGDQDLSGLQLKPTEGAFVDGDKTKLDGLTNYTHPTGDGNLHVPANGVTNDGKVLTAGITAGTYTWETVVGTDDQDSTEVATVTTGFDGNLSTADDTVQKALDTLDNLVIPVGGTDDQTGSEVLVTTTGFNNNLSGADSNVQLALDTLDDLVLGTGTVTSVALTMPTAFSVAGSAITTSGTLAVTVTGGSAGEFINHLGAFTTPTDTNTTYVSSDFTHNSLTGVSANEHIDWTAASAGTIHATNYTDTDTVYTHPNHSGDVTSVADGAQTLQSVAITGQSDVTPVAGDFLLFSDTSDSGNLKKVNASLLLGGGGGITVQEEGTPLATDVSTLNFIGVNVTAAGAGAVKTITINDLLVRTGTNLSPTTPTDTISIGTATPQGTDVLTIVGDTSLDGCLTFEGTSTVAADAMKIHQEEIGGVGRITFEATTGSLLTVIDDKDNELWTASDVSGNPIGYIDADWNVRFGNPFNRPLELTYDSGTGANDIFVKLGITGANPTAGDVLKAVDSTGKLEWGTAGGVSDGNGIYDGSGAVTNGTEVDTSHFLTYKSANNNALNLYRTSNTVGFGVTTSFFLQNSASAKVEYGNIGAVIDSNTAGSHDGSIDFNIARAGVVGTRAIINKDGVYKIPIGTIGDKVVLWDNTASGIYGFGVSSTLHTNVICPTNSNGIRFGKGNTTTLSSFGDFDVLGNFTVNANIDSNGGHYQVNGTKVVGARGNAVANITTATASGTDAAIILDLQTKVNLLLTELRASTGHGLIA